MDENIYYVSIAGVAKLIELNKPSWFMVEEALKKFESGEMAKHKIIFIQTEIDGEKYVYQIPIEKINFVLTKTPYEVNQREKERYNSAYAKIIGRA